MGVPEENRTWLKSEKQDGAEVGDVGVKREYLRKTGHGMKVKYKMARR